MSATLGTTELNALAAKLATDATHAALFTSDPGLSGTNTGEVSGGSPAYARKAITWGSPSGGVVTSNAMTFDIPSGTTLLYAAICSSSSGNTVLGRAAVTSVTFGGQSTYVLTLTFTETSV